jgi:tetratricopeptide repeat protein
MQIADIAAIVVFGSILALPIWGTGRLFKSMMRRRRVLLDRLAERGSVHTFDMPLTIGIILFGAGAVFAGFTPLLGLIWIFDGDAEAGRVFLISWPVFGFFALAGWLAARPSLRVWISEPHGVTVRRVGILHRDQGSRRERHIAHDTITGFHERRSLAGAVEIRGVDRRLVVSMQLTRFDEFLSGLRRGAPNAPYTSWRDGKRSRGAPDAVGPDTRTVFAISARQTRVTIGSLVALLLFFVLWPWFFVGGESPVRDSFIFVGIGVLLWAMIAGLVAVESFPRRQPTVLELRPQTLAWRLFRTGWQEKDLRDVVTVTVETDIIYVRGFPGYRHPLRVTFVDGSSLEINDARARHMRTSTRQLGEAVRAHVHAIERRSNADRVQAEALVADAAQAQGRATPEGDAIAVDRLRRAVAVHPHPVRLARLRHIGDLHRRLGEHDRAVSLYRAHLDHAPDDSAAWEGLAASFRELGRDDLAAEATEAAERILLRTTAGNDLSE